MTRGALHAAVGLGLAGLFVEPVLAAAPDAPSARLDPRKVIEQSERAIGRKLGNYRLIDSTGASVPLRDYRGKPLVISLIYTACSSVCPPTTQHLIGAVNEANRVFGPDRFNVLTVGFDARNDTPARLAHFASVQGVKIKNWRLASADPATIEALLHDLGFSYASIAGGFDHVTQTTILGVTAVYRRSTETIFHLVFIEPLRTPSTERGSFSMSGILIGQTFGLIRSWRRPLSYRLWIGIWQRDAALSLLVFQESFTASGIAKGHA